MIKNYFLRAVLLLFILISIVSCRNEIDAIEKSNEGRANSKIISLTELQSKIGVRNISKSIQVKSFSQTSKLVEFKDFIINPEQILEIQNKEAENSYSLLIYPKKNTEKTSFYNLIINIDKEKNIYKSIFKYTPDKSWLNDFNNKIFKMYRGDIEAIYVENQPKTDPIGKGLSCLEYIISVPCEYDNVHWEGDGPGKWCLGNRSHTIPLTVCSGGGDGGDMTTSIGDGENQSGGSFGGGGFGGGMNPPQSLDTDNGLDLYTQNLFNEFKENPAFSLMQKVWLGDYTNEKLALLLFWNNYYNNNSQVGINTAQKYIDFLRFDTSNKFKTLPADWVIRFLNQNQNTSSEEFQNWFLTDTSEGFLQQIVLENPSTLLEYVSISPNFKLRRLDQIKYPRFTQMVKGLKDYVQNNPLILNKLIEISGMSQAQILDKLTFEKGPQIELIPGLLYVYKDKATPVYGKFSQNSPEVLKINENYVLGLQQASLQSTIEATHFLLAVTVLHEFVHYGNFLTGFNPQGDEAGNLFENSVYGVIVTKYNAHEYIISINKK